MFSSPEDSFHVADSSKKITQLMLSIMGKTISRLHSEIFFLILQKIEFDISCKMSGDSLLEMLKLIFWEKNIINLTSVEFNHSIVSVK